MHSGIICNIAYNFIIFFLLLMYKATSKFSCSGLMGRQQARSLVYVLLANRFLTCDLLRRVASRCCQYRLGSVDATSMSFQAASSDYRETLLLIILTIYCFNVNVTIFIETFFVCHVNKKIVKTCASKESINDLLRLNASIGKTIFLPVDCPIPANPNLGNQRLGQYNFRNP